MRADLDMHLQQKGTARRARGFQWNMPAPQEIVGSLRARTAIEDLICGILSRRSVEIASRDDYVTVRAGSTGAIAMFAHADRVAICLPPERSYQLADQRAFQHQIPRTPVTSYVIVPALAVRRDFRAVLDVAIESVDWRGLERTSAFCAHCGVGCGLKLDACPNCWTEVGLDGNCLCRRQEQHIWLAS